MLIKKQYGKLLVIIIAGLLTVVLFIGLYGFYGRQRNQDDYIAELNGEKIEIDEYRVYLYLQKRRFEGLGGDDIWEIDFDGQTGESLAKQFALDNVVYIKVAMKEAERQKFVLTEEEERRSLERAAGLYQTALESGEKGNGLAYWEKVCREYELYRKLYEQVTEAFTPDPEDFDLYFQQYYETNRLSLVQVEAQVIRAEAGAPEAAQALAQRAASLKSVSEADFEALHREESRFAELSYETAAVISLPGFPEEVVEAAHGLRPGELSPLITTDDGAYLLRIRSVTEPDRQALEEEQWEAYVSLRKNEIFDQEYAKWARDMEVVKNQSVWDMVGI